MCDTLVTKIIGGLPIKLSSIAETCNQIVDYDGEPTLRVEVRFVMGMSLKRGWCNTLAAGTYHRLGTLVICRMKAPESDYL
jgi:hypothetical protein